MGIAPDSILGVAVSTVTDKIRDLDTMASNYSSQLNESLTSIAAVKVQDVPPPSRLEVPDSPVPEVELGNMPTFNPVSLSLPNSPAIIDIESLLTGLEIGELDIPTAPDMPLVTLPDMPSMADVQLPDRPIVDTDIHLPDAPQVVMPELEALERITLPVFEFPELPTFDSAPPNANGIVVPNVFINWNEPDYQSEILIDLQGKVKQSMLNGGTGLPPAIEDALYSRARARDAEETERSVQEAVDTWASRNFSMPPGMLVKQADVIREQGRVKAAETNRDITIEVAKYEIDNMRFMIEQGMALEQITTNLYENTTKRLFEVARFQAESQINVFNAQISLFNAQNSAFETLVQVYKTKLDTAISKLTAYKTAIDGQVALGQINQQRVEVFKAKLEAVTANVEVYKATMQGASVRADAIKNQFDAYRADVQAYSEQINAEKVKVDAYEARVRGETAKVGMYESQSRAYASTIQGLSSKAEIQVKGAQLKMEAARTKVSKFLADVDGYKANLQANMNEVQFNTTAFTAQVDAWRAKTSAYVADSEMKSRFADMNTRTNIAYSEMQMSEYNSKMQHAIQQAQIALDAAKAVGAYTAQLAAGAMSAAHVSASISGGGTASSSDTTTTSTSTNTTYSY